MTPDDLTSLRDEPFATAIRKLEQFMAQGNRAFLLGAGCSKSAGLPLTGEMTDLVIADAAIVGETKSILEALKNRFHGSANANIEDYLSELIDLLAISERRTARLATNTTVELGGSCFAANQLRAATENTKKTIAKLIERDIAVETHRRFVRAVQKPTRPGRPATEQPVDYLILNYDTLIESALALERIPFTDGLDGGVTGWWNPDLFDRTDLLARVLKLHGSIDWCQLSDDPLPRRVSRQLQQSVPDHGKILIWPASTKYQETQNDPFAQLIRRARQVLHPQPDSQQLLVVCGYSFSDTHVNLEIERALRGTDGRLTVVVFTSQDVPIGQLKDWHNDSAIREQLLIYAKRGFFHGRNVRCSEADLPWWKFETVSRLLGGER